LVEAEPPDVTLVCCTVVLPELEMDGMPSADNAIASKLFGSCRTTVVVGEAVEMKLFEAVSPVITAPEYDSPRKANLDVADRVTVMVLAALVPVEMTHHSSTRHEVPWLMAMCCAEG
jgi:hypothetical protein